MPDTKRKSLWILLLEEGHFRLISHASSEFDEAVQSARAGETDLLFYGVATAEMAEWVVNQWQNSRGARHALGEIQNSISDVIKNEGDFEEVARAVRLYAMSSLCKLDPDSDPVEFPDAELDAFLQMVEGADED